MHKEAIDFLQFIKNNFPTFFENKKVLDVGAGDINGNNRSLFIDCEYEGNDLIKAPNVTIVSKTSALEFDDQTFDTIISSECFEHDPEYKESLQNIIRMLKPGGLFAFTCASTGRPEHGTMRTSINHSYATIGNINGWKDHYKNLTFDDIKDSIDLSVFKQHACYYSDRNNDLYFWGIKTGNDQYYTIPEYSDIEYTKKFKWSPIKQIQHVVRTG